MTNNLIVLSEQAKKDKIEAEGRTHKRPRRAENQGVKRHAHDRRQGGCLRRCCKVVTAFYQARSMMALGCIDQRAQCPSDSVVRQWNHSIVRKWWFVPTWEASERALELHKEVSFDSLHLPPVPVWQSLGIAMTKAKVFEFESGMSS